MYPFDFTRQTFIFATTESDRIFPPLKDRFTMVDFEPYSPSELGEILKSRAKEIKFSDQAMIRLQDVIRNNARSAVMRAKEIQLYCESRNKTTFTEEDFEELCDHLGILAKGISSTEKQILEILSELGQCSLTMLAARTGLSPSAVRKHHETYLLRRGLMQIDGKRKLTQNGKELIHEIHRN